MGFGGNQETNPGVAIEGRVGCDTALASAGTGIDVGTAWPSSDWAPDRPNVRQTIGNSLDRRGELSRALQRLASLAGPARGGAHLFRDKPGGACRPPRCLPAVRATRGGHVRLADMTGLDPGIGGVLAEAHRGRARCEPTDRREALAFSRPATALPNASSTRNSPPMPVRLA